jgi:UDP-N-acetylmuramate--alanine ligase
LLDIYPARELPIEGVTSEVIFNKIQNPNKILCNKTELVGLSATFDQGVILMMGAGDIELLVGPVKQKLMERTHV